MDSRFALSRSEEEKLLKQLKSDSLKTCEIPVSAFADCGKGRTVSVVWACRTQFKAMQACMATQMTEDRIYNAKVDFLRDRRPASTTPAPLP